MGCKVLEYVAENGRVILPDGSDEWLISVLLLLILSAVLSADLSVNVVDVAVWSRPPVSAAECRLLTSGAVWVLSAACCLVSDIVLFRLSSRVN